MRNYGGFGDYDRDTCACECGTRVAYEGLEPRFASVACRIRWAARLAICPDVEPAPMVLDARPQDPPPVAAPVAAEEVAAAQTEFAQRVTVVPQVEAALETSPSGMWVQPGPRLLGRLLKGLTRKVR